MYSDVPPVITDYLISQDNKILNTQSDDKIYVDIIVAAPLLTSQNGNVINTQDNKNIIT